MAPARVRAMSRVAPGPSSGSGDGDAVNVVETLFAELEAGGLHSETIPDSGGAIDTTRLSEWASKRPDTLKSLFVDAPTTEVPGLHTTVGSTKTVDVAAVTRGLAEEGGSPVSPPATVTRTAASSMSRAVLSTPTTRDANSVPVSPTAESASPTPKTRAKRTSEIGWSKVRAAVQLGAALTTNDIERAVFGTDTSSSNTVQAVRHRYVAHPHSTVRRIWDVISGVLVLILIFWVPFELGFEYVTCWSECSPARKFFYALDVFMDIFFTIDVVFNFRTAYYDDGELVSSPMQIATRYFGGWFWIDIVATIPYGRFVDAAVSGTDPSSDVLTKLPRVLRFLRLIRLARLLRLLKLRRLMDEWAEVGMFATSVMRLLRVGFYMLIVGHMIACTWYFIAAIEGLDGNTWAASFDFSAQDDFAHKYTVSVYWAFVTLTTVGYGDVVPQSDIERRFVMVCCFLGNGTFAYIVGKMTALASRVDVSQSVFQEKMDAVDEFVRYRNLPRPLRKRIRSYYESFWSRGVYFSETRILNELSFSLRRDVAFWLAKDLIETVPFFKGASEGFIAELVTRLAPQFCQKGDAIVRVGDVAHDMYLIQRGEVVVTDFHGKPMHVLRDGAFFGEIALLEPSLKRTASVIAIKNCDLYTLARGDVDEVLLSFPDFRDAMMHIAESRLAKSVARHKIRRAEKDWESKDSPTVQVGPSVGVAGVGGLIAGRKGSVGVPIRKRDSDDAAAASSRARGRHGSFPPLPQLVVPSSPGAGVYSGSGSSEGSRAPQRRFSESEAGSRSSLASMLLNEEDIQGAKALPRRFRQKSKALVGAGRFISSVASSKAPRNSRGAGSADASDLGALMRGEAGPAGDSKSSIPAERFSALEETVAKLGSKLDRVLEMLAKQSPAG